jgi:hypothetical protein
MIRGMSHSHTHGDHTSLKEGLPKHANLKSMHSVYKDFEANESSTLSECSEFHFIRGPRSTIMFAFRRNGLAV